MDRIPTNGDDTKYTPTMDLAGQLLVAAPKVEDDIFSRSVCLVLQHAPEQSVGVLLNRPFSLDVRPLWEHLTEGLTKTASPPDYLNFGGPNSGPVVAIHDRPNLAEAGGKNGVYLAAQVETLRKLALVSPDHYRLFVGHSVWPSGQLEKEVHEGFWYPIPASHDIIFVDVYDMWKKAMNQIGSMVVQDILRLGSLPASPHLN
jgi:putative transcriptional regulator